MTAERPLRADAERNRSKILEAADRQIVVHGPEVRMEAIAEEAGVAVGTLYRHFPTKDALVAAVVEEHVEWIMAEVEATADRMEAGADALDEFRRFLLTTVELAASDKAAKAAARALGAQYDIARPVARGTAGWWSVVSSPPSVAMPLRLWRGDTVMLCVAGLLILPAALGRWRLGRLEGGALIVLYVAYVGLALWSRG